MATDGLQPEAVRPYNIHVSSKYLDLTRKKLELTRLPHEILIPKDGDWSLGTPKSEIEPLVDFWLEDYDWREREQLLNEQLPQFRTLIPTSPPHPPLRIHFVHKRSSRLTAIPLLYCHSWPGGILEVSRIIDLLTEPEDEGAQAFHVVVPSIPGCGFSDSSTAESPGLRQIVDVFDGLMARLEYAHYVAHGTDWGFLLCRMLALHHPSTCLAIHTATPVPRLRPPSLTWRPWQYVRYLIARSTGAKIPGLRFGYATEDFSRSFGPKSNPSPFPGQGTGIGLSAKPYTLAYALCDSPVGLLAWTRDALHRRTTVLQGFTSEEVIDFTMISWLPGPEAPLRMLHNAPDSLDMADAKQRWSATPLGISAFTCRDNHWPIQWAGCVQPLAWVQRHDLHAGWPVWQRPLQVARDMSAFFGETIVIKDPRLREGWIAGLEAVD